MCVYERVCVCTFVCLEISLEMLPLTTRNTVTFAYYPLAKYQNIISTSAIIKQFRE